MAGEIDIATLGIKIDASTADDAATKLDNLANSAEGTTSATNTFKQAIAMAINVINANSVAMGNLTDKMSQYRANTGGAGGASDDLESRLSRLRATIDPMGVAIDRVNDELIEARVLFEAGAMSAQDYARAQVVLAARSADFTRRQGMMNAAMGIGARSAKLQGYEMLNLSRQFADIAVTGAMGMNPLMILVQQGPQIADVLATARSRGISAADAFKQMGSSVLPWVTRLAGPLAIGAVAFAAIGLAARGAGLELGNVQAEFDLTDKQMDRLKEKGVDLGFTMGDVMSGIASAVAASLNLDDVAEAWNKGMDFLGRDALNFVESTVGFFGGMIEAIKVAFNNLPRSVGAVMIATLNIIITYINDIVRRSTNVINNFLNAMPEWVGVKGDLKPFEMKNVANPLQGTMDEISEGYARGSERAKAGFRSGMASSRSGRIREGAGEGDKEKAGRTSKPKKSDEERDYEQAVKGAENYIKALREETEAMGLNRIEAKQLATDREIAEIQAAAATLGTVEAMRKAHNLTLQMTQAQYEWENAVRSTALRDFRRDLTDTAEAEEFETSLIGLNNEARAKAMAQREIDIKLRALERDGIHLTADEIEKETERLLRNVAARGRMTDAVEGANRAATAARDMADSVRDATESFGDLFGTVGEGYSNVMTTIFDFMAQQEDAQSRLIKLQADYNQGNIDAAEYAFERSRVESEMAQAQIANYGNLLGAAKTFFKEGSTGWKILEGAERVYRLFQFAMAIRAMFMDKAQTASSVANSGARAAADGIAAVAKAIASLPFPLNIAAGAATLAFLVAIGVKMFGGRGGSGASKAASDNVDKAMAGRDIYSGPRDEYGAPTSGYSVLKPGTTTVAGYNNTMYGTMPGVTINQGDTNITVQGNMVEDTVTELMPVLDAYRTATVQETRAAVAQDQAARSTRQRIGGS